MWHIFVFKFEFFFSLSESYTANSKLQLDNHQFLTANKELDNLNLMLKDEHQALQLAFAALEDKLRKTQDENRQLLDRLMKYKSKDADKLNEENENFLRYLNLNFWYTYR